MGAEIVIALGILSTAPVGLATEIAEGEIYGTALEQAYLLESKRAKYPRIVIGEKLWGYLSAAIVEFEKRGTPDSKALKAIVQKMLQFVSTDTDGERILDYLGAGIAELMRPGEAKAMVQPAYDFIIAEQHRLLSIGDGKLVERYGLLRGYFESRFMGASENSAVVPVSAMFRES